MTLLCEPNVSEGRRPDVVDAMATAIQAEGVRLIHRSSDPDHHRSVFAYVGRPDAVERATRAMCEVAFAEIDMREHAGQHPRIGAVDVVPFVPLGSLPVHEAEQACRRLARWVGSRGVPVFFYERSATRRRRRALPDIRRGGYEGLADRLARDEWHPDEGPARPHPRSGALIAGVRDPLVRLNVDLATDDLQAARSIARTIRESSGGLTSLRAVGVYLESRGRVQVAMNLTRYQVTGIERAVESVVREAGARGIETAGTEFIGPVPLEAVRRAREAGWDGAGLDDAQILDFGRNQVEEVV